MNQEIRFCTSRDGTRIGYATSGKGSPLVMTTNWLSHLEFDWDSPVWRHWITQLSKDHTLIRYDQRGCGLSAWEVKDLSLEALIQDLDSVVSALDIDRFPLLGVCSGGPVAIAYAAQYPEKVSHLILHGSFGLQRWGRESGRGGEKMRTMIGLVRSGWGQNNPAFRQFFTTLFMPEATPEQMDWYNELQRRSTAPEIAENVLRMVAGLDISALIPKVKAPTLVLHSRDDALVSFQQGCELGSRIPDARFVALESKKKILLGGEPAWQRFLAEFRAFVSTGESEHQPEESPEVFPELTPRQREVLDLISRGYKNHQIAGELYISPKTVSNHINRIFSKLQVDDRAQAIVLAREAGLGRQDPHSRS